MTFPKPLGLSSSSIQLASSLRKSSENASNSIQLQTILSILVNLVVSSLNLWLMQELLLPTSFEQVGWRTCLRVLSCSTLCNSSHHLTTDFYPLSWRKQVLTIKLFHSSWITLWLGKRTTIGTTSCLLSSMSMLVWVRALCSLPFYLLYIFCFLFIF